MGKRIIINKASDVICRICELQISRYGMTNHLKFIHNMLADDYEQKYEKYRNDCLIFSLRDTKIITCGICNKNYKSVGMFVHLRDSHNITPDEYVKIYNEYRPSKLREIEYRERLNKIDDKNKQQCVICNEMFASGHLLGGHIKKFHNITKKEYIINYFFKGTHPVCLCGCGKKVKLLNYYPYKVDYRSGHNPNPMTGLQHSNETKKKMSVKAMKRIQNNVKTIDTEPELKFKAFLESINEIYEHPKQTSFGLIDFYLPERDLYIEIDGVWWHPEKLEKLNFARISVPISDKRKNEVKNLIRIRSDNIDNLKTYDDLYKFQHIYNFNLTNKQKIIDKEYFIYCLEKKGKEHLKKNVWLLLKFIRTFQPTFPFPTSDESLADVINILANYDLSSIYNKNNNTFSNNVSIVGNEYLKCNFLSYWKSNFTEKKSPVDTWNDDKIIKEIIEYRIGCNNSGEVFDFSLHQIIRGMSSIRIPISFFKPMLAAAIYNHYLKNIQNPIVLDPCCGFGGRLLGFKSKYPNGTYIGCEPNIETYSELIKLKNDANWNNVEIYNCKFEDFNNGENRNYDLIFTSIPYYNLEVYSNNVVYNSFDEWKNTFISAIEKYKGKNCYINTSVDIAQKLSWNFIDSEIISTTTHFSKNNNFKKEYIIKL